MSIGPTRRGGRSLLPLATAALGAASLASPRLARALRRRGVPERLAEAVTVAGVVAGGWAVVAVLERARPLRHDWSTPVMPLAPDAVTDLGYITVVDPVTGAAAKALATLAARPLLRVVTAPSGTAPWPSERPLAVRVALALLITELIHYWQHRLAHTVDGLWQFHAVHHSSDRLTWHNAPRFHPVDSFVFVALQDLSLLALGVDADTFLAYTIFRGVHGQLQHANVAGTSGALNTVVSTADQHRWHHAILPDGASCNYGAVFSVWDTLFGTRVLPDDGQPFDAPVGVAGSYPTDLVGQLLEPFRRLA